ncbi:MAG: hypothetical protein AABZ64_12860 [Nitrospinota bacterium]
MSAEPRAALQVHLFGYRLRVTGPASAVEPLRPLFYTRCQEPAALPPEDLLEIRAGDGGYAVRRAGEGSGPLLETEDWSEVFWWLDGWFFEKSLEHADSLLQIHAAAAAREGRAILLVGDSHAGKTSLTLHLILLGFQYLSDETILVDPATLQLRPFPRNLMVREGTVRGDASLERLCRERPECRYGGENPGWFLDPALLGGGGVAGASAVERIVCLEKKESGPPLLEKVGMRAAVEAMVRQQANLRWHGAAAGVDTMIRLAQLGRNWRLSAVHPGEAWAALRESLGPAREPGGRGGEG